MIFVSKLINKDYAWEISAFNMYRAFSDGISFVEFNVNWDRYEDDHSPGFSVIFVLLNFKVFEFNIYYIHHRD